MAATGVDVNLPEIKGIYHGKFKDRNPDLKPAGKLTATGDSSLLCMKPISRPPSPEIIRRFRASLRPDAGKTRIFYGKAYDPHLRWAAEMTHGIYLPPSIMAGDLINPNPNSYFTQSIINKRENQYASNQRAPLGRSHDQTDGLPAGLDPESVRFGIQNEIDGSAGELINPNKTWPAIERESEQGHDLYVRTHADYHPGEQRNRKYYSPNYQADTKFGVLNPHDNSGRNVRKLLHWLNDEQSLHATPIVSKRVDDFRERTQPQLGQVHDPIKDTLKVGPGHVFGILVKPDEYGAGDLIHWRGPRNYLRGKDRIRGAIAAMRQHLKKENYSRFNDLIEAFKFYDKDKSGKINMHELREACQYFNLPVDPELMEELMEYCDTDRDGYISYLEFANFLNWKDKLPLGFNLPMQDDRNAKDQPQSAGNLPFRIQKQIDHAIGEQRTSSALINSTVGKYNTKNMRSYGVPTIRSDLPAPRIRRVNDTKNYGDESNAYGLLNPSIYSHHGVFEKDFLLPRPKDQIYQIFKNIGLQTTLEDFDSIYTLAASQHPHGLVSVETFRNALDMLQSHALQQQGV